MGGVGKQSFVALRPPHFFLYPIGSIQRFSFYKKKACSFSALPYFIFYYRDQLPGSRSSNANKNIKQHYGKNDPICFLPGLLCHLYSFFYLSLYCPKNY